MEVGKSGKITDWHAGEEESRGFVTKSMPSSNYARKTSSIDDEAIKNDQGVEAASIFPDRNVESKG